MTTTTQTPSRARAPARSTTGAVPEIFPHLALSKKAGPNGKTRGFSVQLAGYLRADHLTAGSTNQGINPVWMAYLGTQAESQAFTANFRAGRTAIGSRNTRFRILRQSGHRWTTQTIPVDLAEAVITVAYLPDLFHLEPLTPIDDKSPVCFVFAPPHAWIEEQAALLGPELGDDAHEAAEAALFVAFLDRRTHLPIVADLRFHLALYRAAKEAHWVSDPAGTTPYTEHRTSVQQGMDRLGIGPVLAAHASQQTIATFIREQTAEHKEVIQDGTTWRTTTRRLLPFPDQAPTQLCFDFEAA